MNWLERHLREFVFPSLKLFSSQKAAAAAGKAPYVHPTLGSLLKAKIYGYDTPERASFQVPANLEPMQGEIRPMKIKNNSLPGEVGLLFSVLKSMNLWKNLPSTVTCLASSTLRSDLNLVGSRSITMIDHRYNPSDHAHWYLKSCVKALRRRLKGTGNKAILLGRDVWLVSVLCERMGVPYVYDPRVSRQVADGPNMVNLLPGYCLKEGDILFDTGFAGSIHRAVSEVSDVHLGNLMMSAHNKDNQVFPNSGIARNYALFIEYLPKYFETGRNRGGEVVQHYADLPEFVEATLGTIWAWHNESPSEIISKSVGLPRRLQSYHYSYY